MEAGDVVMTSPLFSLLIRPIRRIIGAARAMSNGFEHCRVATIFAESQLSEQ